MEDQGRATSEAFCTQVFPESMEIYTYPLATTAASLVPSAEEVIDCHSRVASDVFCTQVFPESMEV